MVNSKEESKKKKGKAKMYYKILILKITIVYYFPHHQRELSHQYTLLLIPSRCYWNTSRNFPRSNPPANSSQTESRDEESTPEHQVYLRSTPIIIPCRILIWTRVCGRASWRTHRRISVRNAHKHDRSPCTRSGTLQSVGAPWSNLIKYN